MNVKINDGCIGCGLCADTCSKVFQMNDDNVAKVISQPSGDDEFSTQEAADNCPVGVIEVI